MAKAKEVTTKFKVDVSEFTKGISEANNQIKLANAKFKEASSKMEDWEKSTDGLQSKIEQLNSIIEAQSKKIKNLQSKQKEYLKTQKEAEEHADKLRGEIDKLNKEYEESVKATGENSKASKELKAKLNDLNSELTKTLKAQESNAKSANNLEIAILNEQASLNKTNRELEKHQKSLDDVESGNKEVAQSVNKVEKANDEMADSLQDVKEASEGGFTVLKGALADLTSNVIQSAVSGIKDLVGSFFELVEATEEYRSMQAKLEGSAKNNGKSIEFAQRKYKEFYKYVGDDQMATNAVTNLMGLEVHQSSLSKIMDGAIGVWASYGDSIPIESLTEAINETIQVGKVTGTFADTINWASISNEDMAKALGNGSKAQKAFNKAIKDGETQEDAFSKALEATSSKQERANIVAKFLNDTYGETKKTYDEVSKGTLEANEAQLKLKETQAKIGETLQPVTTAFSEFKNNALKAMLPIIKDLAEKFMDFKKYLEENKEIASILKAVLIGLATGFTILAGALAIQTLITGVQKAFALLNSTLLANPIVLIGALIVGLVAGIIYLWNNCEWFRDFVMDMFDVIKKGFKVAVDWVIEKFKSIVAFLGEKLDEVVNFFKSSKENIVNTFKNIGEWFKEKFTNASNSIKNAFSNIGSWFIQKKNEITNAFSNIGSWFREKFSNAWQSIKNVFSNWGDFFGGLWTTIKDKFSAIGTNISDAISSSVKSGLNGVISLIERTINSGIGMINGAIDWINKIPSVEIGKLGTLSLPRLAQGGLAKKNNPFMAIVGDNPTQDEIISPVGTIRKIVSEELEEIKRAMNVVRSGANINNTSNSKVVNVTYNQNINSPKALSRWDINRDTRNTLKQLKGVFN